VAFALALDEWISAPTLSEAHTDNPCWSTAVFLNSRSCLLSCAPVEISITRRDERRSREQKEDRDAFACSLFAVGGTWSSLSRSRKRLGTPDSSFLSCATGPGMPPGGHVVLVGTPKREKTALPRVGVCASFVGPCCAFSLRPSAIGRLLHAGQVRAGMQDKESESAKAGMNNKEREIADDGYPFSTPSSPLRLAACVLFEYSLCSDHLGPILIHRCTSLVSPPLCPPRPPRDKRPSDATAACQASQALFHGKHAAILLVGQHSAQVPF